MKFSAEVPSERIGLSLQKVLEVAEAKALEMRHSVITLTHVLFAMFSLQNKDWIMEVVVAAEKIKVVSVLTLLESLLKKIPAEELKEDKNAFSFEASYRLKLLLESVGNERLQVSHFLQEICGMKELKGDIEEIGKLFDSTSFLKTLTLAQRLSTQMFRPMSITDAQAKVTASIQLIEASSVTVNMLGRDVAIPPLLAGILFVSLTAESNHREKPPADMKDDLFKLLPLFSFKEV